MDPHEAFKLKAAILAIYSHDGQRTPIMVPAGATVIIENGPLDGLRMVDVMWEGKNVMMFTADLRERATRVKKPNPASPGKRPRKPV